MFFVTPDGKLCVAVYKLKFTANNSLERRFVRWDPVHGLTERTGIDGTTTIRAIRKVK